MAPDEARRAARAAFGSVASVSQQLHEGRRGHWLSAIGQDVRYGVRAILKHRLLSCSVVLTMSVGIGCTTAVFGLLNAIVFGPPVAYDPDSFVQVVRVGGSRSSLPLADVARYEALRNQTRSLRELAAWSSSGASATLGAADSAPAHALLVSCNLFKVLSDAPALAGRLLQPSDCADRLPVAVISEGAWRRRFEADPGIVGRSMPFGRHVVTIVGVAPHLLSTLDATNTALWLPYTLQPQMSDLFETSHGSSCFPAETPACKAWEVENAYWLRLAGRLAPGTSRSAAAAELKVLTTREASANPNVTVGLTATDGSLWSAEPAEVARMLALVLVLPTVIALIVCANVASLLLSRAVKRQQEMAIRLAVGGGRLKLVRMLLVEQMLLASIAAVLSLWLVVSLLPIVVAQVPGMSDVVLHGTRPDWRVLSYLAAVTLLTAIGAGTAPALESLNLQLVESLKGRRALSGSSGLSRSQGFLICSQVVLSMVPLVGTAAFLRAERRIDSPGFDADQVVLVSTVPNPGRGAPLEWPMERVEALASVRSTALSTSFPPNIDRMITVERPGMESREFPVSSVSPGYFRTLGISLLSGRVFRDGDARRGDGTQTAVVSLEFARRVFHGQDAVGQTFDVPKEHTRFEIVGVVSDVLTFTGDNGRFGNDRSLIYEVLNRTSDNPTRWADPVLLVRVAGDVGQFAPVLQSALKPVVYARMSIDTLQSVLYDAMAPLRLVRTLVMATAGIALALALIGVFGILAFTAAQRRKEVAIRSAVGASREEIFGSMIRPALRPIGLGIAIGAAVSFGALRFFESVSRQGGGASGDVAAYLAGAGLLLCAALAAMSSPAWRAATADPSRALRED
jgi:predicted permease